MRKHVSYNFCTSNLGTRGHSNSFGERFKEASRTIIFLTKYFAVENYGIDDCPSRRRNNDYVNPRKELKYKIKLHCRKFKIFFRSHGPTDVRSSVNARNNTSSLRALCYENIVTSIYCDSNPRMCETNKYCMLRNHRNL